MSIKSLGSKKIYKVTCQLVGAGGEYFGKYDCRKYVSGYSNITNFDDKDKSAFCNNLGYWIDYDNIDETALTELPEDSDMTSWMTKDQVELLRSGRYTIEQLYDYKDVIINNLKHIELSTEDKENIEKIKQIRQNKLNNNDYIFMFGGPSRIPECKSYVCNLIPTYNKFSEQCLLYMIPFSYFIDYLVIEHENIRS